MVEYIFYCSISFKKRDFLIVRVEAGRPGVGSERVLRHTGDVYVNGRPRDGPDPADGPGSPGVGGLAVSTGDSTR